MKNFKNEIMSDNWPRWTGVLKNQYIADASSLQLKRHSAVSLWHYRHLVSNPLVGVSDLNPELDWTSLTGGNEATGHHWAGPVITAWGKIALSGAVTAILTLSFRGKWPQHCSIIFVIILLLRLTLSQPADRRFDDLFSSKTFYPSVQLKKKLLWLMSIFDLLSLIDR